MNTLNKFSPYVLALLRVSAGYMFLLHGMQKLFGLFGGLAGDGMPVEIFSMMGIGGIIETLGGLLLILGLFTRPAAFLMSGQMAYAYFFMHASSENLILPLVNKGELALLYSVVFLYFVFAGSGACAIDNKLSKK